MNPKARELVAIAESLGFTFDTVMGSGHIRLQHPNGAVVIPSTPSEYRGAANAVAQMERVSGRKVPRSRAGRSRKKGQTSGFDLRRAAQETTRWHDEWDERIQVLTERRDTAIDRFRSLVARGDRPAVMEARDVLACITKCEADLREMNQHVERFDPLTS